jgi:hypothetical protein
MPDKERPCGHPDCSTSTTIDNRPSFGRGALDQYGYWSKPCSICARYFEEHFPELGKCWPFAQEGLLPSCDLVVIFDSITGDYCDLDGRPLVDMMDHDIPEVKVRKEVEDQLKQEFVQVGFLISTLCGLVKKPVYLRKRAFDPDMLKELLTEHPELFPQGLVHVDVPGGEKVVIYVNEGKAGLWYGTKKWRLKALSQSMCPLFPVEIRTTNARWPIS